jgi:hypothetical protein
MPTYAAIGLSIGAAIVIVYLMSSYSALGNLIMNSGALSENRIVSETFEEDMTPTQISEELLKRKRANQKAETPVNLMYRPNKQRFGLSSKGTFSLEESERDRYNG